MTLTLQRSLRGGEPVIEVQARGRRKVYEHDVCLLLVISEVQARFEECADH